MLSMLRRAVIAIVDSCICQPVCYFMVQITGMAVLRMESAVTTCCQCNVWAVVVALAAAGALLSKVLLWQLPCLFDMAASTSIIPWSVHTADSRVQCFKARLASQMIPDDLDLLALSAPSVLLS